MVLLSARPCVLYPYQYKAMKAMSMCDEVVFSNLAFGEVSVYVRKDYVIETSKNYSKKTARSPSFQHAHRKI